MHLPDISETVAPGLERLLTVHELAETFGHPVATLYDTLAWLLTLASSEDPSMSIVVTYRPTDLPTYRPTDPPTFLKDRSCCG